MAVFPVEDDICEKKASDFLWETLYKHNTDNFQMSTDKNNELNRGLILNTE